MGNKYTRKEERLSLAREIAREAIVLLKNEGGVLPLAEGTRVAVFGKAQYDTIIGGGGSGQSHSDHPLQITEELRAAGLVIDEKVDAWYREQKEEKDRAAAEKGADGGFDMSQLEGLVASGLIYELFGRYSAPEEEPVPETLTGGDTAILVIGRCSGGEECDRRVENDYYLLPSELTLAKVVCSAYEKVILVLNVNGAVDTAWTAALPQIRAILFMGTAGEQGAGALADIVTGMVSPSGKLSQTLACSYEDYPTAKNFSWNKDDPDNIRVYTDYGLTAPASPGDYEVRPVTVYEEDIYLGYRYFESFQKEVMFPFGYGLSYAEFSMEAENAKIEDGEILLQVKVCNTSERYAGKEVVQVYLHAESSTGPERPEQELKAFVKTALLQPKEEEVLTLRIPLTELAVFDEDAGAYVIPAGKYELRIGNSSAETKPAARIKVCEEIVTRRIDAETADIGFSKENRGKVKLKRRGKGSNSGAEEIAGNDTPELVITAEDVRAKWPEYEPYQFAEVSGKTSEEAGEKEGRVIRLQEVAAGTAAMEEFIGQMSVRELAVLCNGYGPGLPFGGIGVKDIPSTIPDENGEDIGYNSHRSAFPGYENPAIRKYGIYSACYKDGPASVGDTAWPTGMMLGCTFSPELLYAFGEACGYEAEQLEVDSWLAPGMNLIRNPIEGRAFEYFSEDPYLAGVCGTQIALGAMENNEVTVCPKHFALNEQETYRRGKTSRKIDAADTIVSARAARELYLKPFEMVITKAKPRTVMTSFNKINGVFAAGNSALNTGILRGEWGYTGVVVTDWGDMDAVVDGADAVAAGNDVVMPGGPPVIAQVLKGYEEGRVSLREMRTAAAHLMNYVMNSRSFREAE